MLEKSFNQMSLVLDTMSELVAYQDNEHKLIYVNRASAESVGKTPEELVGKYCYEIWGDGKTVCQDCPVERALRDAEPETGYIQSPDGRSWKIKGYPVKNEKGEIIVDKFAQTNIPGLFAAGDVTDIREKQVITACGQAVSASYSVRDFLTENSCLD